MGAKHKIEVFYSRLFSLQGNSRDGEAIGWNGT